MKPLSFEDISSYWYEYKGYLKNEITLNAKVADIDDIIKNIYKIVSKPLTIINEGKLHKKKTKKNPLSFPKPNEYIANKVGYNSVSKYGASFYNHGHVIEMTLANGEVVKGEIRISDHEVDLDAWAATNQYDFGISVVVYENDNDLIGNNLNTDNRVITIYEYIIKVNRQNQNALDDLSAQILNIKKSKKFKTDQRIRTIAPIEVINLNESSIELIKNEVEKFFRNK